MTVLLYILIFEDLYLEYSWKLTERFICKRIIEYIVVSNVGKLSLYRVVCNLSIVSSIFQITFCYANCTNVDQVSETIVCGGMLWDGVVGWSAEPYVGQNLIVLKTSIISLRIYKSLSSEMKITIREILNLCLTLYQTKKHENLLFNTGLYVKNFLYCNLFSYDGDLFKSALNRHCHMNIAQNGRGVATAT